jgi:hypothetical protein
VAKDRSLDESLAQFLKGFGLPEALTTATASSTIPDEVWSKIEEFQKKGMAQNFSQTIKGSVEFNQMNRDLAKASQQIIDEEE